MDIGKSAKKMLAEQKKKPLSPTPATIGKVPPKAPQVPAGPRPPKPPKAKDPASMAGQMKGNRDEALAQPSMDPDLSDEQKTDRAVMDDINKTLGKGGRGRPKGISPKGPKLK